MIYFKCPTLGFDITDCETFSGMLFSTYTVGMEMAWHGMEIDSEYIE